ncbi:MAG: succinylglutamate desuccinylase/aspartoacylase family protein [Calditrichaeota bacterium]|nr:succinylglutamate desuccinylase/aspartoacylase family protein [Calditrichota bacterium]MCB9366939.1 succinylglutamate desuccinylase/aspartoacylase family protein [Calditrichota bacterium]
MKSLLSTLLLLLVLSLCLVTGLGFRQGRVDEPLYPSPSFKRTAPLSNYFAQLKNTPGDTEIFEFGEQDGGGTVLVLGGTHCDEPASYLAAYLLIENLKLERGRVLVVPRANRSALSHTTPGEAFPASFEIETANGPRRFRMGSRYTNPLDQWPDPEVFVHYPSGQELSGMDSRNLNRNYPGRADGSFTQRVGHALAELVRVENVDLVIDLHEASLEYPVINAIVAHERAMDCASIAVLELQLEGLDFALEPSPANFHGLSHRELGDHTACMATLMESANVIQGRLRGRTGAETILKGQDPMYVRAAEIEMTRVPYTEDGIPLEVRVGRHIEGVAKLISGFNQVKPERAITYAGVPGYSDLQKNGLGHYLSGTK